MRTALASTWTLLLGMALLMLGTGLQGTLVGLRASLEGFPVLLAGVMLAAYYLGYMAGSLMAPALVRSVGHIRVFAVRLSVALDAGSHRLWVLLRGHLHRGGELAERPRGQ
jgi:MFS family permease